MTSFLNLSSAASFWIDIKESNCDKKFNFVPNDVKGYVAHVQDSCNTFKHKQILYIDISKENRLSNTSFMISLLFVNEK